MTETCTYVVVFELCSSPISWQCETLLLNRDKMEQIRKTLKKILARPLQCFLPDKSKNASFDLWPWTLISFPTSPWPSHFTKSDKSNQCFWQLLHQTFTAIKTSHQLLILPTMQLHVQVTMDFIDYTLSHSRLFVMDSSRNGIVTFHLVHCNYFGNQKDYGDRMMGLVLIYSWLHKWPCLSHSRFYPLLTQ